VSEFNEEIYSALEKSGLLWAFSMLCMFIGIFMLYNEISSLKNPCREKNGIYLLLRTQRLILESR
jgi:hypothetical protein